MKLREREYHTCKTGTMRERTDAARVRETLLNALLEYHLHMGGCQACDKIVCEDGDDLWFKAQAAIRDLEAQLQRGAAMWDQLVRIGMESAPAPASVSDAMLETLAERVHTAYLETCARLGWSVSPANAVPYAELSDAAKELDRATVRAVLSALPVAPPGRAQGQPRGEGRPEAGDPREALRRLLAELSELQVQAVREGCGNTNAAVLQLRIDEARTALVTALRARPAERDAGREPRPTDDELASAKLQAFEAAAERKQPGSSWYGEGFDDGWDAGFAAARPEGDRGSEG